MGCNNKKYILINLELLNLSLCLIYWYNIETPFRYPLPENVF